MLWKSSQSERVIINILCCEWTRSLPQKHEVIIHSQTWWTSLFGFVARETFQLSVYFVNMEKDRGCKSCENTREQKVAVAPTWLSPVQHWPCLLTYAYILPSGTRSVHTVPLADVQRRHVISFFFFSTFTTHSRCVQRNTRGRWVLHLFLFFVFLPSTRKFANLQLSLWLCKGENRFFLTKIDLKH